MPATLPLVLALAFAMPQDAPGGKAGQIVPATPIAAPKALPQTAPAASTIKAIAPGDAAPALQYDAWIKGDKLDAIEKGHVHVIEFWATWCGPCIAAMPHLSEIQRKHPEVRIVSMAASERGESEDAKIEKVRAFVENKGDTMGYRVAYVGDRAKMSRPWMEAAGQSGIPCSFIVDREGMIAWIGHPMSMDKPLEAVVAGTWNVEEAAKQAKAERAARELQRGISMAMRDARQSGDYTNVVKALRAALEAAPTDSLRMQLFQVLAAQMKASAEAWAIGEEIFANAKDNAMALNQLAWFIVDPDQDLAERNLGLAEKAIRRAVELTDGDDGAILDTHARVHFLMGNVAKAVEIQKTAIEKAPEGAMREEMKATLATYEAAGKKA
ncbi:MAG: Thiol-disulfide oxidoreductase ResA [Planctomycetota bacterium]|jgi:thiol-disulfide isomerase/thioredoxin